MKKIENQQKEMSPKMGKQKTKNESEHLCGAYNGVMGKGSFTKTGDQFVCLECGKTMPTLPEAWVKTNPEGARLLLKGQKSEGPKNPVMIEAGKKSWETRRKNAEAKAAQSKKSSKKNVA